MAKISVNNHGTLIANPEVNLKVKLKFLLPCAENGNNNS
jgi:hypothetical protein